MSSAVRYVRPKKFESDTGITVKAIERKIETGAWREGHEYRRGPDHLIYVDVEGYEKWVENRRPAA